MRDGKRALIRLSAAIGLRDGELLSRALAEAGRVCPAEAVEETLLQSYLFVGYPAAMEALKEWRERESPTLAAETVQEGFSPLVWRSRGDRVCSLVYGGQYERLRANVARLHPDLEQWMVVEGYGKVLGRPGLSLALRELCIVALLAALEAPRQLYSHLRGAINVGVAREEVAAVLEVLEDLLPARSWERALTVWERLSSRLDQVSADRS